MEAVDDRIQTRSQSGHNQYAVEVVEGEFVCPHVVSINNQPFDIKAVTSGDVEDQFGPFVPCLTPVQGEGKCSNCKGEFRTSGEPLGADEEGAPMALPKLKCPHPHSGGEQLVDPVAVLVKGSKDSVLGYTNCPECKRYFTVNETDLLKTIDVHGEAHCPSCKQAVDPLMNACTNAKCKLAGVLRNVDDFDGVCWRCGGLGMCPNCKGSGQGNLGIYGEKSPSDCWTCGTSGRCPECDSELKELTKIERALQEEAGMGFSVYQGVVPMSYSMWTRGSKSNPPKAILSGNGKRGPEGQKVRKWRFDHEGGGSGGDSDDSDDAPMDDLEAPEAPDDEGGDEPEDGGDEPEDGGDEPEDGDGN
jgi:hypothetical protein